MESIRKVGLEVTLGKNDVGIPANQNSFQIPKSLETDFSSSASAKVGRNGKKADSVRKPSEEAVRHIDALAKAYFNSMELDVAENSRLAELVESFKM